MSGCSSPSFLPFLLLSMHHVSFLERGGEFNQFINGETDRDLDDKQNNKTHFLGVGCGSTSSRRKKKRRERRIEKLHLDPEFEKQGITREKKGGRKRARTRQTSQKSPTMTTTRNYISEKPTKTEAAIDLTNALLSSAFSFSPPFVG